MSTKAKESIPLPRQFLPLADSNNLFILQAKGHGMYPSIVNGDHLICEHTDNLEPGDCAVLQRGKKHQCKTYRKIKEIVFYENASHEIFDNSGWKLIGKVRAIYRLL